MPGTNIKQVEATERSAIIKVASYAIDLDLTTGAENFRVKTTVKFAGLKPGATTGADANLRLGLQLWKNKPDWKLADETNDPDAIQNVFNDTRPASDVWLIASGVYNGSSFKHFRPDSIFSRQVEKIGFRNDQREGQNGRKD